MTFEQIQKANEATQTVKIKEKDYVQVNERIKAFRMLWPEGFIHTDMFSNEGGVCVIRAEAGYFDESGKKVVLGTGTAYEKESNGYINKTSYIENCETSAVGRALGMLALGIDTSIASAEEVDAAIKQQEQMKQAEGKPAMISAQKIALIQELADKAKIDLSRAITKPLEEFTADQAEQFIEQLTKRLQSGTNGTERTA